jgi:cellobiose phosphorylase
MKKATNNPVTDLLQLTRSFFGGDESNQQYKYEAPLRAELYSYDQMEQRGRVVAKLHKLVRGVAPNQLLNRLADNEHILIGVRDLLADAVKTNRRISPAGEWLLDNFYLIEEQIILAKKHFPKSYSSGLPRLVSGNSEGLPRVYDIALEIISHSDGRVDLNTLTAFVSAYQEVDKLTIGELWAIPIMLRLALIENLRRVSARIAMDKIDQNAAAYWSELLMKTAETAPKDLVLVLADMARTEPLLESPFVSEMNRQLLGKGPALTMPLTWMEQQLSAKGTSSNELVHFENQKQAVDQVSVSNCIGSLKFLGSTDWKEFFETLSSVDEILRQDPAQVYSLMDFATRDAYRHMIEALSKFSELSEQDIALTAIRLSQEIADEHSIQDRRAHVGYFLLDIGRRQLRKAVHLQLPLFRSWRPVAAKAPLGFYLSGIALLTLGATAWVTWTGHVAGVDGWMLALVSVLAMIISSQLSGMMINWLATQVVPPRVLPKMDFSKGIPSEARSLVVVPTMLTTPEATDSMIEAMEVRYLANSDPNLHYALLTDFTDAPEAEMPGDTALVDYLQQRVLELNEKYPRQHSETFFLFHRSRRWNVSERCWMGYERKRGKLGELNELLRGGGQGAFSTIVADTRIFPNIKYIITLDSDTQLPREAASKLVAAMSHPLNTPVYDEKKQRVVDGHGILQPRVAVSMPPANASRYLRMHANDTGLDPYTRSVSDVYQDLFAEGSFIGKGIYDIDILEKALHHRLPENRILSHDLLEGNYVRSGLLSDVLVYEENPSRYGADVRRRHRWIRGDWQVASWMLPWVPRTSGKGLEKNKLSALSRWKIFDNIRRNLVTPATVLLLLLGWIVLPRPGFWTATVLATIILPPLITSGWSLLHPPPNQSLLAHIDEVAKSFFDDLFKVLFQIACLPYEAYYTVDAIIRTLWRMHISHRHLLEWTPSGSARANKRPQLHQAFFRMWIAPVLSFATVIVLGWHAPHSLRLALPILILWTVSPGYAWFLSEPVKRQVAAISQAQKLYLHRIARKTWNFFEHFVTAEDNWLPPDNFQEHPVEKIAHRSSPTNFGMSLLAHLSAYDFGYLSLQEMSLRMHRSIDTMEDLERYNGHFYNWYDTRSLQPLPPRYISTVDSGNLAGHLLTLRQGLLELIQQPAINARIFKGIRDTGLVIAEYLPGKRGAATEELLRQCDFWSEHSPGLAPEIAHALDSMLDASDKAIQELNKDDHAKAIEWIESLKIQINDQQVELSKIVAHLLLPNRPERLADFPFLHIPTLKELTELPAKPTLIEPEGGFSDEEKAWVDQLTVSLQATREEAFRRVRYLENLSARAAALAEFEYDFLFDRAKNLLRIGYNVDEQRRDPSHYDLLATEARLGHFVGIAQGKLPQDSWFALGRLLTNTGGDPVLLSWSGSMFEYLMPLLVMPGYSATLLDETHQATVRRQIAYGELRNVPWGISEACYNAIDADHNYQYRAFGVPGLGLKRGLSDDLVIAPYATMMAAMVNPEAACANLQRLTDAGFEGGYGFYESIDYTSGRIPRSQNHAVVRSFMVHHQAMGLLSLEFLLLDQPMQRRFCAEPQLQATLLLLQERVPKTSLYYTENKDVVETHTETTAPEIRVITTADTPNPEVQLLTNSRYQVVITNAGGGYSSWKNIAVTRWREDSTMDNWGVFCYIKDLDSGTFWSNTFQPTLLQPRNYEAIFSQGQAEFHRRDPGFDTRSEVVVSPEDDIEMRRVRVTNRSSESRTIELTSYAEVVLSNDGADVAHPAFNKLFVQTEIHAHHAGIICSRRPRSQEENPPWMFHQMSLRGATSEAISFETDRMRFIGRGNTVAAPAALLEPGALSGSQGSVLDPIVAIRYRVTLKPGQAVTVDLVIGMGDNRDVCLALMEKYFDRHLRNRAFEMSWTHSQVLLRQINATEADAQLYGRLASSIIYTNPALRADPFTIKSNHKSQSGLWAYSISGDLPIILLRVQNSENIALIQQMIQSHAYWRLKGLAVDLVIWNEDHGSYRQALQDQIVGMVNAVSSYTTGKPGGVFVRSADQISNEDRILFQTVARAIIYDNRGTLAEQINRKMTVKALPPALKATTAIAPYERQTTPGTQDLLFGNGHGGFSKDGKEYVIITTDSSKTPVPWANVIANREFGMVISESGSAYTWAENAHEFRLSPWYNDPVCDRSGEAYYIRDEESGAYWSPSPLPAPGQGSYTTRHGFGYSVFEHEESGIVSTMTTFVDVEEPVKFIVIKVRNDSDRHRLLSLTGFVEWVLGDLRQKTQMHVVTEPDAISGALLAVNRYNSTFADRVAFFDTDDNTRSFTADRMEFIGRNGNLRHPAAMLRSRLSGRGGSGLDPCAAIQVSFDLQQDEEREIIFRLGSTRSVYQAQSLIARLKGKKAADESLQYVHEFWERSLGAVQVKSPDPALNVLANGWLTYQTLASRLWGRSGYYQSGGAYGFRDQLQDVLSLLHIKPEIARDHIILFASHQFREGDVQHWWHPPLSQGVRTRCSDDYLWLPYATARYLETTGDKSILNVPITYLEGRLLNAGEESYYDQPTKLEIAESLYQHCIAAIRHSFNWGVHGLPLMGSGDWNDGMDRVGIEGKGESVWLAFFLYNVLQGFSKVAEVMNDEAFAHECLEKANELQKNIEENAWDGEWYRRAYFDDGAPLGSKWNEEGRIDAISQSWSVLSGAGSIEHSRKGLAAVDQQLVRRDLGLIKLLTPPFDKSALNPGYIKGYVPGVRENGGQYTHSAIWTIMAFAALGDREKAYELFSLINPVNHGNTANKIRIYKAEPYVAAADIYAVAPHEGRGGWTWYTGSAGWMNYLILSYILGLKFTAGKLSFQPCIPAAWDQFEVSYSYLSTTYLIVVVQQDAVDKISVELDGAKMEDASIPLKDDKKEHQVKVVVPRDGTGS